MSLLRADNQVGQSSNFVRQPRVDLRKLFNIDRKTRRGEHFLLKKIVEIKNTFLYD